MFPDRVSSDTRTVQAGLSSLLEQMTMAEINTPRRIAAFLTTIAHESRFLYNIKAAGDTRVYAGRGFIQLTGTDNYAAAGAYLGVALSENPEWARNLEWSAPIARWYWTKARPKCNEYADALQMGKINAAIGYPRSPDGSNDQARCLVFQKALQYLTGGPLEPVDCAR